MRIRHWHIVGDIPCLLMRVESERQAYGQTGIELDELIERVPFLCNAPCSTVVKILLFNDRATDVAEPDGMG